MLPVFQVIYTAASLFIFICLSAMSGCTSATNKGEVRPAPATERIEQVTSQHHIARTDYFHWLSKELAPKVVSQIWLENSYAVETLTKYFKSFGKNALMAVGVSGLETTPFLPFFHSGWHYFFDYDLTNIHPIISRKRADQKEQIFDANGIDILFGNHIRLSSFEPSPDGLYLIIGIETIADSQQFLYLVSLKEKNKNSFLFSDAAAIAFWSNDSKSIYHLDRDPETTRETLVKRSIQKEFKQKELLYQEAEETRQLRLTRSASGQHIFLNSFDLQNNEIYLLSQQMKTDDFKPIIFRTKGISYSIDHQDGLFFLISNHQSPNGGIYSSPRPEKDIKSWKTIVAPQNGLFIRSAVFPREHIVIEEQLNSSVRIRAFNRYNQEPLELAAIPFDQKVSLLYSPSLEYSVSIAIQSPIQPVEKWTFDLLNQARLKENEAVKANPGTITNVQSQIQMVAGSDGRSLPIILYHKKGFTQNGQHPAILTFRMSAEEPDPFQYNPNWKQFFEQGIILAVAMIQNEFLQDYRQVKDSQGLAFQNGIYNLIACAESLINQRWVHPDRLAVIGYEEGAWIISAALNLRPSLFSCASLISPITDPLSLLLDSGFQYSSLKQMSWGNPTDKKDYEFLLKTSPYEQLEPKDYPSVFLISTHNHKRIPSWQALKWGSKLRLLNTSFSPVFIVTHKLGQNDGLLSSAQLDCFKSAFLFKNLGFGEQYEFIKQQ